MGEEVAGISGGGCSVYNIRKYAVVLPQIGQAIAYATIRLL